MCRKRHDLFSSLDTAMISLILFLSISSSLSLRFSGHHSRSSGHHSHHSSKQACQPRAFVLAKHVDRGLLLLRGYKPRKGVHFQLPGGRMEDEDEEPLTTAARELFEETGVDVRDNLTRLHSLDFDDDCRTFFIIELTDADSIDDDDSVGPLNSHEKEVGFTLRLSPEHTGFLFEQNRTKACEELIKHSGGACSEAVRNIHWIW
eukprot:gnl/TRDRNA2_/TRDRNA2_189647_c0_seq1.p1 gnl/TRDRNA2_/TRDRNA2_189647_c0~~gnl/TRDRNA2_/TRDRNA2_189647_c0_seq1.p1  ORF type:complete len:204 (+),score=25.69 gnl/TRDRNA2_/TRDRNA2_189647_c0_seq1:15-626(+)